MGIPAEESDGMGRLGERDLGARSSAEQGTSPEDREFLRAENEDDDGYDPYSDRRPQAEPLFERDPWG